MPDPVLMLGAMIAAAVAAAAIFLIGRWPWKSPPTRRAAIGGVLGVAAGLYLGCWLLGIRPNWPPAEDRDRLLLYVLPPLVAVELLTALPERFRWIVWPLRALVAIAVAPILLHNTVYVADLAGPGTREWTPGQMWLIFAALAALLAVVWTALVALDRQSPGRSIPLAVAMACGGAALVVMLSGYATGGQFGLPLAAALTAVVAASLVAPVGADSSGQLSLGVVGLFSLLVIGIFFGELWTSNALLIMASPLACWLTELPYVRRLKPWQRGVLCVALTAVPIAVAIWRAQQKFAEDWASNPYN